MSSRLDIKEEIKEEYFKWLYDYVCIGKVNSQVSYINLFKVLHSIPFTYIIKNDVNRAVDGVDLRNRFIDEKRYDYKYIDYLRAPCSVLEMMIALAIRCEETIMDDIRYGNRTKQWFWDMLRNLRISWITDDIFLKCDENIIKCETDIRHNIDIFLNREYEPDGLGGLFYIRNCPDDLRNVEIWTQLCWYLNYID